MARRSPVRTGHGRGPCILDFGEWSVYKRPDALRKEKMLRLSLLLTALLPIFTSPAAAQHRTQDRPGVFDSYLLALSWIPAYCAQDGDARDDPRCRDGAGLGWAVHGLWPQFDNGQWPEYCATTERNPSRRETTEQEGLFGTSGSAWHQWNKHGRCSGLSAADYYRLVQTSVDRITLPEVFGGITRELSVDPDVVEAAFIEANPALTPDRMVTACPGGEMVELRICLDRSLNPVECAPALTRRECSRSSALFLPVR